MRNHFLHLAVFVAGLAIVSWIGIGYIGSNPLGALVAAMIALGYLAGAAELYRYRQSTAALDNAVNELSDTPAQLGLWLDRLPANLRNAVRLRVEGERVALPSPTLTSYLVGLLVLLGMLGTLLGMMATLRGTGIALESATDLQAIRGSLAAPVKGLGFAFGTSIAGVATSAMLGLLSALARRERLHAVQRLDAKAATTLHVFSQAYQRDASFRLLQQQTELMPALIDRLQSMMAAIEQQGASTSERHAVSQESFHVKAEATFVRLAASVEQSLKNGVADSARAASAALQPVVEATMQGIAAETKKLHEGVNHAVERQLDGLSKGFDATSSQLATAWRDAITDQRTANETLVSGLKDHVRDAAAGYADTSSHAAKAWNDALAEQRKAAEATANDLRVALSAFTETFESRSTAMVDQLAARNEQAMGSVVATFDQHANGLVDAVRQAQVDLQSVLESRDEERLKAWTSSLGAMTDALASQWKVAGDAAAAQHREMSDTLAKTANDITAQAQSHASDTIAEISRLVDAASEAPKAAAEVVAELRQKLSDSMVRDTAMLEERSRLLETLETLLGAVNHASTEQRAAIDGLVTTSADLLDRVGTRFVEHVEGETGKLTGIAEQITGGAEHVASLGEAFGTAVQAFGQTNDALMERLQAITEALDRSLIRSDEQLAYYVAQAREVVDLSVLSQKQIVEDMQKLASKRDKAAKA